MKKHISGYKLNRDSASRLALMKSLVASLIAKEEIVTTTTKARAIAPIFEKLITHAKSNSLAARRLVQAYVQDGALVSRLFSEIAPRYKDVHGGYTKMITVGSRRGDNATVVRFGLTKKSTVAVGAKHLSPAESTKEIKKSVVKATTPEKVQATKAAPKLVKRTGKRGDK
jgi:large subunit ribosomal protein L17